MKVHKSLNRVAALMLLGLIGILPASVWAQDPGSSPSIEMRENFSDDELKSFVKANEKITAIQMEGEQKMIRAIEDEGLTVNRFQEILEQQRDPQRGGPETSDQELKSFNNAARLILEENAKLEEQMTSSIEEEGIDIETYQQIMLAYQQNPAIQSRVNKMVNGQD